MFLAACGAFRIGSLPAVDGDRELFHWRRCPLNDADAHVAATRGYSRRRGPRGTAGSGSACTTCHRCRRQIRNDGSLPSPSPRIHPATRRSRVCSRLPRDLFTAALLVFSRLPRGRSATSVSGTRSAAVLEVPEEDSADRDAEVAAQVVDDPLGAAIQFRRDDRSSGGWR